MKIVKPKQIEKAEAEAAEAKAKKALDDANENLAICLLYTSDAADE